MSNQKSPPQGRTPKYPWEKWLNRKNALTLRPGIHFDCQPRAMNVMLRENAKRLNRWVSITTNDDGSMRVTTRPR